MDKRSVWVGRGSRLLVLLAAVAVVPACGNGGGTPTAGIGILAKGGNATGGGGGAGGEIYLYGYVGKSAGILKSGKINLGTPPPAPSMPFLGANPLVVSSDGVLKIGSGNSTGGATGAYLSDANGVVTNAGGTVTGIWVQSGATLTIQPNWPTGAATLHTEADVVVADGWFVEGRITTLLRDSVVAQDNLGPDPADFYADYPNAWVMTGSIDLSGASNVAGPGANGGSAYVYAYLVNNAGPITTKGGDGSTDGGSGGSIYLYQPTSSGGWVANTATLNSNGGNGAAGVGGGGGYIQLEVDYYGAVINSGYITAVGGNGTAGGGSGNEVYIYSQYSTITNSGTILTYGGNATSTGNGGDGGEVYMWAYGRVTSLATLDSHGGNSAAAGGGTGGELYFNNDYVVYNYLGDYVADSGGVYVGGALNSSGGDGVTYGGDAGEIYLYADCYYYASGPTMDCLLVGYDSVNCSGGDGSTFGGGTNGVFISAEYTQDENNLYFEGECLVQVDIVQNGGNSTTGAGGSSDEFDLESEYGDEIYPPYTQGVTITANLTGMGGNGVSGGTGSQFFVYAQYHIDLSGTVNVSGGNGSAGTGGDGGDDDIGIYCYGGPATLTGNIIANGGTGTTTGGPGCDSLYIEADSVVNKASVVANGGAGVSGGTGGDGGYIFIFSTMAPTTPGAISAAAGAGGTPTTGYVYVDGVEVSGP